jgi:hypothetical protein
MTMTKQQFLDMLNDVPWVTSRKVGWRELPDDWNVDEGIFYCLMPGGDGLGSQANREAFTEMFPQRWIEWSYGSVGVFADDPRLPKRSIKYAEIEDVLRGMDNYPILDEDKWSETQSEAEEEAWGDWIADDFANAVVKLMETGDWIKDVLLDEELVDLRSMFYAAAEAANVYVEEDGSSGQMYVDVAKVANALTKDIVMEYLYEKLTAEQAREMTRLFFDDIAETVATAAQENRSMSAATSVMRIFYRETYNDRFTVSYPDGSRQPQVARVTNPTGNDRFLIKPTTYLNQPALAVAHENGMTIRLFSLSDLDLAASLLIYLSNASDHLTAGMTYGDEHNREFIEYVRTWVNKVMDESQWYYNGEPVVRKGA